MGTLYVTATPIGNLGDITKRAIKTLKRVDAVVCEDTSRTIKLLNNLKLKKKLYSFHEHSSEKKLENLITKLKQGSNLAFLTDSGTPVVSDPGARLVRRSHKEKIPVVPLPGPSAITTSLSISGFPAQKFLFLGYVPKKKKKRKIFFRKLEKSPYTTCFFETPHRIIDTLKRLRKNLSGESQVFIGRELTKKYESIYFGSPQKVAKEAKKDPQKGEYTLVVKN